MTNFDNGAGAVTQQYDFCSVNRNGDCLFSVRGGVPLSDAFDKLSIIVANANSVMEDVAAITHSDDSQPCSATAAVELLDVAYALIQSMHLGYNRCKNSGLNQDAAASVKG